MEMFTNFRPLFQSSAGVPVCAAVNGGHGVSGVGVCDSAQHPADTAAVTGRTALPQRQARHHQWHH
jgi:hypothetical protein